MKDSVQVAKDLFAALKDAALVLAVLAVIVFPTAVKTFLRDKIGFDSLTTPIGSVRLQAEQVRDGAAALTALDQVRRELPPASEAARSLDVAVQAIQSATGRAQQSVAATQPSVLPTTGWIYLGTLDQQRRAWKPGVPGRTMPTVAEPFQRLAPGTTVSLLTNINLREGRPLPDGPLPQVIGVARGGQRVRLLDLDSNRPAEPDSPDAPGYRVFARVELPPGS